MLQVPSALSDAAARLRGAAATLQLESLWTAMPSDDLMLALVSPEAYWLLREWRHHAYGAQEALRQMLGRARTDILAMSARHDALRGAAVSVRSKGLWSTFHKATLRQKEVLDVLAIRVVVRGDADACYEALHAIRERWPSAGGRFKDYVRFPKANGYQSLHDTLLLPNGMPFEVQIRSEGMHREAEFGAAAHRRYKTGPVQLSRKMLSGIANGIAANGGAALRWPLHAQDALSLSARLAA